MKAIVQDKFGSPDTLELREIDKPGRLAFDLPAADTKANA